MQAPDALRRPFTDPDWLYEIKYDGYRCLARVEGGKVQLLSKALKDFTRGYPEVIAGLARLDGGPHLLDGELCVLDKLGVSDFNAFHALRANRTGRHSPPVTYCVFDLLVFDGQDVMHEPLEVRKTLLQLVLLDAGLMLAEPPEDPPRFPHNVLFVDDLPAHADVFQVMVRAGLPIEGVVAKRRASTYHPGVRSADWLKIKRVGWNEGRVWRS
jgi:ATP-dependent DNA ligase